jgi:PTS system cellobiose-specific IIB component
MIRIAICCGGGFSSSALANHLQKELLEKGLSDRASFVFIPFHFLYDRRDEVDIGMLCPHLEWAAKRNASKFDIPLYIIPPKLYGLMPASDFIDDAEDIIELWKQKPENIMTFPEEPRPLQIKRMVSHRRWLAGEKAEFR